MEAVFFVLFFKPCLSTCFCLFKYSYCFYLILSHLTYKRKQMPMQTEIIISLMYSLILRETLLCWLWMPWLRHRALQNLPHKCASGLFVCVSLCLYICVFVCGWWTLGKRENFFHLALIFPCFFTIIVKVKALALTAQNFLWRLYLVSSFLQQCKNMNIGFIRDCEATVPLVPWLLATGCDDHCGAWSVSYLERNRKSDMPTVENDKQICINRA